MPNQHLKIVCRLWIYKDRKKWSSLTNDKAPHKPFLLMAVKDLGEFTRFLFA